MTEILIINKELVNDNTNLMKLDILVHLESWEKIKDILNSQGVEIEYDLH